MIRHGMILQCSRWYQTYKKGLFISYAPHDNESIAKVLVTLPSPAVYIRVHNFSDLVHEGEHLIAGIS